MARKYKMAVARLRPSFHDAVKQVASPRLGMFTGIDSMIQTGLLLLMEDLANNDEFQKEYRKAFDKRFVPPGDNAITNA